MVEGVSGIVEQLDFTLFELEVERGLADIVVEMSKLDGGSAEAERQCKDIAIEGIKAMFNEEKGNTTLPSWKLFVIMSLLVRAMVKRIAGTGQDNQAQREIVLGMLARTAALESPGNDQ